MNGGYRAGPTPESGRGSECAVCRDRGPLSYHRPTGEGRCWDRSRHSIIRGCRGMRARARSRAVHAANREPPNVCSHCRGTAKERQNGPQRTGTSPLSSAVFMHSTATRSRGQRDVNVFSRTRSFCIRRLL
ncbi:hypothetical protein MRX96_056113 [Rhipicephalus microplus]